MGARFLQLPIAEVEHVEIATLEARRHEPRRRTQRADELRPLELVPDFLEQAHGSVL